ncbi:hypothetical protein NQZ68_028781 [Dissostichus eleginoides]|nr:hypothetical protein NQZ68_028781 [Dissostichus eleginoides]
MYRHRMEKWRQKTLSFSQQCTHSAKHSSYPKLGAGSLTAGHYPGPVPPGLLYTKGRTRPYRCCANHEAA